MKRADGHLHFGVVQVLTTRVGRCARTTRRISALLTTTVAFGSSTSALQAITITLPCAGSSINRFRVSLPVDRSARGLLRNGNHARTRSRFVPGFWQGSFADSLRAGASSGFGADVVSDNVLT